MSRETHVQFCESLRVRFPGATHPGVNGPAGKTRGGCAPFYAIASSVTRGAAFLLVISSV
jgi:hypothetical protein